MQPTLVSPIGYDCSSHCGYCSDNVSQESPISNCAYYISTPVLQVHSYKKLLDRGWRRSGSLIYKPNPRASCCARYTIRLDSHAFHATKDQRQAQNRFNRYIQGDAYIKEAATRYPKSREQARQRNNDFDLAGRAHESETETLKRPPEPAHTLKVVLESDEYTDEKFALFENYQRLVHKEPPSKITRSGFREFLCSSPLVQITETHGGKEQRMGSFHQCYYVDGNLVAMGVLDLLPECVSAVYFIYHESFHQYSFGKLSALREISLAKEAGYRWWYAGLYIQSCAKMRYKGDFSPQYLLDPESYTWDLLDNEMKSRLDTKGYFSLSHERAENEASAAGATPESTCRNTNDAEDTSKFAHKRRLDDPNIWLIMPGALSKEQLLTEVDLDHVWVRVKGINANACDVRNWKTGSVDDPNSVKGLIAGLVAVVGKEVAEEMCVIFG